MQDKLIIQPQNADDSPLMAISGIIDTDKFIVNGHFSFIVKRGFSGIIKQGTPLVQVIPFKRENWTSSIIVEDPMAIPQKNIDNAAKYRVPDGGVYKNVDWHKRSYN